VTVTQGQYISAQQRIKKEYVAPERGLFKKESKPSAVYALPRAHFFHSKSQSVQLTVVFFFFFCTHWNELDVRTRFMESI
jgi:hypothetical protein